LEVITKPPVKLNNPVIDVGIYPIVCVKGAINRYPKILFTNTFGIRFFKRVLNMMILMKFDVGEYFSNAATLLTYRNNEKKRHLYKINVK
jgi:hypothetical protein